MGWERGVRDREAVESAAGGEGAGAAGLIESTEGEADSKRRRKSALTGVAIERRFSAIRASVNKSKVIWENFAMTPDSVELKKGKALKGLEDNIKMIDRQVKDLVQADSVDAELPQLVNSLNKCAALTSALYCLGNCMKKYYIKGHAASCFAEVESLMHDAEQNELIKDTWQDGVHLRRRGRS